MMFAEKWRHSWMFYVNINDEANPPLVVFNHEKMTLENLTRAKMKGGRLSAETPALTGLKFSWLKKGRRYPYVTLMI